MPRFRSSVPEACRRSGKWKGRSNPSHTKDQALYAERGETEKRDDVEPPHEPLREPVNQSPTRIAGRDDGRVPGEPQEHERGHRIQPHGLDGMSVRELHEPSRE